MVPSRDVCSPHCSCPWTQSIAFLKNNLFVVQDTSDSRCVPIQVLDPSRSPYLHQIHHKSVPIHMSKKCSLLILQNLEGICSESFAASVSYNPLSTSQLINEAIRQASSTCKVGKYPMNVFYLPGICTQVVIDHWFYIAWTRPMKKPAARCK